MSVLILTTHLLGTGHLSRALTLARGLRAQGHEATVVSGGLPAPHLDDGTTEIIQLPPVKSDGLNFTHLLTVEGAPITQDGLKARTDALVQIVRHRAPNVLITELYPFGRRVLRDEFDAALAVAKELAHPPLILSSVRDILAPPSSEKRAAWTEERLLSDYHGILVHADPSVITLDQSWPVTQQIAPLLRYTGFVAEQLPPAASNGPGRGDILVTAGGGPVGQKLFETVIDAAADRDFDCQLRLLVGGGEARLRPLRDRAASLENVYVEPTRPDFRQMLQRASLSISQAGYNTILDVALAGVRAIIAPFAEGGETEQTDRARAYGNRLGLTIVPEADLSVETMCAAIQDTLCKEPPGRFDISIDGAMQSATIIEDLLAQRGRNG